MSQSASDLIMGGGGPPAIKFESIGALAKGQIVETATAQQKDFKTGELKYWKDQSPMMQAIITLQTDQHDDADDDGRRRLFVSSRNMRDAVRDAVIQASAKALEVGGTLAVQYTGDGEPERGMSPPKLYAAEYKQPAVGVDALAGDRPTSLLA